NDQLLQPPVLRSATIELLGLRSATVESFAAQEIEMALVAQVLEGERLVRVRGELLQDGMAVEAEEPIEPRHRAVRGLAVLLEQPDWHERIRDDVATRIQKFPNLPVRCRLHVRHRRQDEHLEFLICNPELA